MCVSCVLNVLFSDFLPSPPTPERPCGQAPIGKILLALLGVTVVVVLIAVPCALLLNGNIKRLIAQVAKVWKL